MTATAVRVLNLLVAGLCVAGVIQNAWGQDKTHPDSLKSRIERLEQTISDLARRITDLESAQQPRQGAPPTQGEKTTSTPDDEAANQAKPSGLKPEELKAMIQDPDFQQLHIERQVGRVSEYLLSKEPRFQQLPYDQQLSITVEIREYWTREMLNVVADAPQVNYYPKETVIDREGWIKAKELIKAVFLRATAPQIDLVDITYHSLRYHVKLSAKENSIDFYGVDRVEIFNNGFVFVRGGGIEEGIVARILFDNQKDAKSFADLIMSFRKHSTTKKESR